jgi:hypothetical protein
LFRQCNKIVESGKEKQGKRQGVRNSFGSRLDSVAAATFTFYLGNPVPRFLRSCPPQDGLAVASFRYLNLWLQRTRSDGQAFQSAQLPTLLSRSSAVGSENLKKFSLNPLEGIK